MTADPRPVGAVDVHGATAAISTMSARDGNGLVVLSVAPESGRPVELRFGPASLLRAMRLIERAARMAYGAAWRPASRALASDDPAPPADDVPTEPTRQRPRKDGLRRPGEPRGRCSP